MDWAAFRPACVVSVLIAHFSLIPRREAIVYSRDIVRLSVPAARSGPIRLPAGCRKRRQNQALSRLNIQVQVNLNLELASSPSQVQVR